MKLLIIGNGVAGITTARFVAEKDPAAEITIYAEEPYAYYARPRLIDLLAGQMSPEQMSFYPPEWYAQRRIRTLLGRRVMTIDRHRHRVVLADGTEDIYDRLVLATGARSFVPPIVGSDRSGVHALRSMDDALGIVACANQAQRAVVLGGGLLGLDTAAALRVRGLDVTVVEMQPRLLPRQLDVEGAAVLTRAIEARGIQVITGDVGARIEGSDCVERVVLQSGRKLEAQMVIISAGVRPRMELAQQAGLACKRGVIVDERLRTSDPDILAVGDVTEFGSVLWCIIPVALAQARVAAAQLVGQAEVAYRDIVPSTTLQVTGIDLTSIGEVNPAGDGYRELRAIGSGGAVYRKLVLRDGCVVGAIVLGERASVRAVTQLIERRIDVSAHTDVLLADGFDLMSLVRAS